MMPSALEDPMCTIRCNSSVEAVFRSTHLDFEVSAVASVAYCVGVDIGTGLTTTGLATKLLPSPTVTDIEQVVSISMSASHSASVAVNCQVALIVIQSME